MLQIQISNFGNGYTFRSHIKRGQYRMWDHLHQNSEVVFVKDGDIDVIIDGRREHAKKNDIIMISPFQVHSFFTETYSEIWIIVFSNNFISNFSSHDGRRLCGERAVFTPSENLRNYFVPKIVDTDENIIEPNITIARRIQAVLYTIYEEYTSTVPFVLESSVNNAISSILFYTYAHCKENITLADVSKNIGYNSNYISHCLKELKGLSFRTLLNSFRVEYAKEMLISKEYRTYKMIDIALECGFTCERTFYRAFLAITGITPSQYSEKRGLVDAYADSIVRPIIPGSLILPKYKS